MTVFKTYFKILRKGALATILINLVVAVCIFSLFKVEPSNENKTFEISKPVITVYDEDKSEFSSIFTSYLDKNAILIDIENTKDKRLEALFYRETDCFVTIPKGFGQSAQEGKIMELETQSLPDVKSSNYAQILINNYLKTFDMYSKSTDLSIQQISEKVAATLSVQTQVTVKNAVRSHYVQKDLFYNSANYVIMTLLISCIALIASSFNDKDIRRRINSSTLSLSSINFQIALGHLVVTLVTLGIVLLMGKTMFSINFTATDSLLHLANIFVFSLVTLNFAYLVSNLVSSMKAIQPITTVVSLGTCFLGGSFVPQEFMDNSVKFTAVVNPVYWYVKANNNISSASVYTYDSLKTTLISMTIEILFGVVFLCISMAITKYKRTQN